MSFRVSRNALLIGIIAAAFLMQNLDSTVITTALPMMAQSFGTTPIHLSIGITAYMMSLAVFIPVSGWVADRYGARTVFCSAIAVFAAGSVLCGLSNSVAEFTIYRIFQGFGGAMMVPVGRLILFRAVGKSGLVRALSTISMTALVGPVLGPPVGGFITTYASWRWIFFLNVPIAAVGLTFAWLFIENYREDKSESFDWIGFLFTGTAIAALVFDCDVVVQPGAPASLKAGLFGLSIVSGAFAAWYMLRRPEPVLDLSLMNIRSFFTGVGAGAFYRLGSGGVGYLMAILLQVNMGFTAFASGSITLASALSSLLTKWAIPPTLRRFGFRRVLLGNGFMSAAAVAACALVGVGTSPYVVFAILLVGGAFRSLQFTSLTTLAYADIVPNRTSAATSFSSMMQQITNGLGVAVAAVLMHVVQFIRGGVGTIVPVADIRIVYLLMSVIALAPIVFYAKLANDAGAEVSGHKITHATATQEAAE